jgi:hypothetical protein
MVNLCVFQVKLFLFKQMLLSTRFIFMALVMNGGSGGIYQVMQHLNHLVLTVFFVYISGVVRLLCVNANNHYEVEESFRNHVMYVVVISSIDYHPHVKCFRD